MVKTSPLSKEIVIFLKSGKYFAQRTGYLLDKFAASSAGSSYKSLSTAFARIDAILDAIQACPSHKARQNT